MTDINLKDLTKEQLEDLKEQIDDRIHKEEETLSKPWIWDTYWNIDADGHIYCDAWHNYEYQQDQWDMWNVYKSKANTEIAVKKQKIITKLNRKIKKKNAEVYKNFNLYYVPYIMEIKGESSWYSQWHIIDTNLDIKPIYILEPMKGEDVKDFMEMNYREDIAFILNH